MSASGIVKKVFGTMILILEASMFWQTSEKLLLEFLPVWHRWFNRISFWIFVGFLVVSAVLYFICVLKDKVRVLYIIWGGVCLFMANTLYASGPWLQIFLSLALILFMMNDKLFASPAATVAVIVVFVICLSLATTITPALSKIPKPELYTRLEGFWWDLFETGSSSTVPDDTVQEETEAVAEYGVPDNMITNDPFPGDNETPICTVKSTYPLQLLHIFSTGSYDPESFTFSLWDDPASVPGSHSPSTGYYDRALESASEYSEKTVITDLRKNKTYIIAPYCAFTIGENKVRGFGDRLLYRNNTINDITAQYSFDPDRHYSYASGAYERQVLSEYLALPEAFEADLKKFVADRGITAGDPDTKEKIVRIRKLLSEEYTFSYEPPELPQGEDPVMWFLTRSKIGHSKHFAAAEVFLYRAVGIPARYSFGYTVSKYNDGEAEVLRTDAYAFCEVYANGAWMLPEDALSAEDAETPQLVPVTPTEVNESDEPIELPNGYDITHLKGTPSMFGSYYDTEPFALARSARNDEDETVVLIVDTGVDVDYIKAYSTGDYSYPAGTFTIVSDTLYAPDFEAGKSFGEYSESAFMSVASSEEQQDASKGFRVFNLYAPRYIYSPAFVVSTAGLAADAPEEFTMEADRLIIPVNKDSAFDDYTLFEGGEPAGANRAYTKFALSKYTEVPDKLLYDLKQFLKDHEIDPDDPDKGALMESVRELLSGYTYTTQIDTIPEDQDPIMWFLTSAKRGYCQHFAAAGTMLLRVCGIPARFVVGYLREISAGTIAEVTKLDAHAWTEVYDGSGWQLVEMCVGTPAEGQQLPSGRRTSEQSYELPSVKPQKEPGKGLPSWAIFAVIAAVLCVLAVLLVKLIKKNLPDELQKAAIQYRYISEYYYVSEDTERLLNKISYSREGAQPEDIAALDKCISNAKSLLLYRRKYPKYAASMINYAFWHVGAVAKNIFSR